MATASSATPPLARSTTWFHGTSAAVSTATTPGTARAAETSMAVILAHGTCARTTLPCSMPGSCQSAAESSVPETLSTKSWCVGLCPTTRRVSRRAGALVSAIGPPGGLVGVLLDRVDDLAVAGAAAQVADQLATDPFAARPPLVLEQRIGRQQHPWRAEAALRRAVAQEARLQRVRLGAVGQAADGHQRAPFRLRRQQQARADGLAVQQHRAGPAHALAAPVADLVMAERVPEHVEQRLVREHPGVPSRAVDREGDPLPADVAHGPGSWFARARCTASASARRRPAPPPAPAAPAPEPHRAVRPAAPPGPARDDPPRRRWRPRRRPPLRRCPARPGRPRRPPSSRSCGASVPGTTSRCARAGSASAPR